MVKEDYHKKSTKGNNHFILFVESEIFRQLQIATSFTYYVQSTQLTDVTCYLVESIVIIQRTIEIFQVILNKNYKDIHKSQFHDDTC